MKKIIFIIVIIFQILQAQEVGDVGISAGGNYSLLVAGLSEWFKPAINFNIAAGQQNDPDWFIEGVLEYSRFGKENLSDYAADHVELSLEHTGILVNGRYTLNSGSFYKTLLHIGGGLYYWKGIRGRIEADTLITPAIPLIEKKILEEWNWGFRTGLAVELLLKENVTLEFTGFYRFIVGDLWPTLQPNILLENVSGFQTINLALNLRYYFKYK